MTRVFASVAWLPLAACGPLSSLGDVEVVAEIRAGELVAGFVFEMPSREACEHPDVFLGVDDLDFGAAYQLESSSGGARIYTPGRSKAIPTRRVS